MKPTEGWALAYLDYSAQEVGIAAALSGDERLQADYAKDPYLSFAKRTGMAPEDATKASHGAVRDRMKVVVLGAAYGLGPGSLGLKIGVHPDLASRILEDHARVYRRHAEWQKQIVAAARLTHSQSTRWGWRRIVAGPDVNPRSVVNFPVQAAGGEILRRATRLLLQAGHRVVAPVHDAILLEVPAADAEERAEDAARLMRQASREVLGGFEIRVGIELAKYPARYADERGREVWERLARLSGRFRKGSGVGAG